MALDEVAVLRPPSPHLGNFNHIFDDFLKRASGTEPRIDLAELNFRLDDAVDQVEPGMTDKQRKKHYELGNDGTKESLDRIKGHTSEASSARTALRIPEVGTPRKSSPRLTRAARGLMSGTLKEFKPSPLQEAVEGDTTPIVTPDLTTGHGLSNSSPETTDTWLHQQSLCDEYPCLYTSEATPLTSPDGAMFDDAVHYTPTRKGSCLPQGSSLFGGSPQTTTALYNYCALGLSGFPTSVNLQSSHVYVDSTSTNYTHNTSASGGSHGYSGFMGSGGASDMSLSPNGRFLYHLSTDQPFPGAELYSVEVAKSGVDRITPHYMCTRDDKLKVLAHKLQKLAQTDRLTGVTVPAATDSVHVFVDLSNITIGFYDCLKAHHKIPLTRRMRAPRFCFDHLAFILERGRNVEKRVVAGSLDSTYARKWPAFMQEAKELDYEMCILQRVAKAVVPRARNKRLSTPQPEWTASDANSSGEEAFVGQLRQGEQGVDEVLHLKMLQSVVDDKPGTAVLATGDAAEAEFSDGFKRNVERLLDRGWNVEIIGWSKGISKAWREPEFVAQYGDRVRVIELDPFVEEIFGAWFGAPGY